MSLVGTSIKRVGIRAKVSGGISYIADLQFTGQIYAKALRSPYAHAKLLRIDATEAAACTGVHAVVTREDLADLNPCFGTGVEDQPVVVIDKTLRRRHCSRCGCGNSGNRGRSRGSNRNSI